MKTNTRVLRGFRDLKPGLNWQNGAYASLLLRVNFHTVINIVQFPHMTRRVNFENVYSMDYFLSLPEKVWLRKIRGIKWEEAEVIIIFVRSSLHQ